MRATPGKITLDGVSYTEKRMCTEISKSVLESQTKSTGFWSLQLYYSVVDTECSKCTRRLYKELGGSCLGYEKRKLRRGEISEV